MLTPKPEQIVGIDFLAANKRAFLFDEPGYGKTLQAIRAANKVGASHVGVICPAGIVTQWKKKIKEESANEVEQTVVSYEKARDCADELREMDFDVLIIDEQHYLKNRKAGRTRAVFGPKTDGVKGIIEKVPYVWGLTGSPAPNHPGELWSQLRAIAPGAITTKHGTILDYWSFVAHFCTTRNNGYAEVIVGGKNIELLKERMADRKSVV